jgi:uroporphyrinogen decarboxylase
LKPVHADLIHFIRQRSSAKIFFHTDGDVYRILDDLVEIGVDILHGVEPYAGEMANLRQLKKRYGQSLCFCGAIDTLHILPLGTPQTVQEEVKRVIAQLGPGGGYLVAPTHALMNTVPTANILALVEAVNRYGHYPLSKA